jgi:hypothetical protein
MINSKCLKLLAGLKSIYRLAFEAREGLFGPVWAISLVRGEVSAIAFHDADIITYDRDFITRLLFPLMHMRFQFVKGYYIRYDKKLYGRVTRLFYFPLVRMAFR